MVCINILSHSATSPVFLFPMELLWPVAAFAFACYMAWAYQDYRQSRGGRWW